VVDVRSEMLGGGAGQGIGVLGVRSMATMLCMAGQKLLDSPKLS
jgi:hypothetical protein